MKSFSRLYLQKFSVLTFSLMAVFGLNLSSCQFSINLKPKAEKVKPEIDPKYLISCEGIGNIKLTDTHQTLLQKFGADATDHENSLYGSFTSIWYEKSDEVNVFWKEEKPPFKTIKYIELTKMDAPYMTKDSLSLGQSLWDIVRVNGYKSVKFVNPSQVKSPGLITTFNGGKIEKELPCLSAILEQSQIRVVHKNDYAKFIKKKIIETSDPLLNRIDYELVAIRIKGK